MTLKELIEERDANYLKKSCLNNTPEENFKKYKGNKVAYEKAAKNALGKKDR